MATFFLFFVFLAGSKEKKFCSEKQKINQIKFLHFGILAAAPFFSFFSASDLTSLSTLSRSCADLEIKNQLHSFFCSPDGGEESWPLFHKNAQLAGTAKS